MKNKPHENDTQDSIGIIFRIPSESNQVLFKNLLMILWQFLSSFCENLRQNVQEFTKNILQNLIQYLFKKTTLKSLWVLQIKTLRNSIKILSKSYIELFCYLAQDIRTTYWIRWKSWLQVYGILLKILPESWPCFPWKPCLVKVYEKHVDFFVILTRIFCESSPGVG